MLKKLSLKEIDISKINIDHHDNGCIHYLTEVNNSEFLSHSPLYVSSEDMKLYGISLSEYHALKKNNIKKCNILLISGSYDEKYDLYLHNKSSNHTLLYHKIREKYDNKESLKDCDFDNNQLDLLYYTDLDNISMDIKEVSTESVKIKKQYNISIVLKTLDDNYKVQKYFKTNKNEIKFLDFKNVVSGIISPFYEEPEDRFYKINTYPQFYIKCNKLQEMDYVLDHFKINKSKLKTTRINFKKVEKFLQ